MSKASLWGMYPESSKPKGLPGWSLENGELVHLV